MKKGAFRLQVGDIIIGGIILCMLLASLLVWLLPGQRREPAALIVRQDGVQVDYIPWPVSQGYERKWTSRYGYNTVVADENGAYVRAADCVSQDCVHCAPITQAGQRIVCLPHRLEIYLSGEQPALDSITE